MPAFAPKEDDHVKPIISNEMLEIMRSSYPTVPTNQSARVYLSTMMKNIGRKNIYHAKTVYYMAVPLKAV